MKTYDDLQNRWKACNGGQILVDSTHPLRMYLNINDKNNKELLIPVNKPVTCFRQTEAIGINNYKIENGYLFSVELLTEKLADEYVCLCFDLIESSRAYASSEDSLKELFETLKKWYSLWTMYRGNLLTLKEIRGLMGELMYMINEIDDGADGAKIVSAWTTHKDADRDFIYDSTWDEIKTIQTSSDYVTISSLEQLEHDSDGRLVVYRLDRANASKDLETYTLNSLVSTLRAKLDIHTDTELTRKLLSKGYSYNQAYDEYEFIFNMKSVYTVNESFPRIERNSIPNAICSAKYDILMNYIENWREQ